MSRMSFALASRSSCGTSWISRPKAALSNTVRWGSNPNCWKTMAVFLRRNSVNSFSVYPSTSSPSIQTDPTVGSIKRLMHRTSVDLPLPERPMTTNVSPSVTSKLTFWSATTQL